MHDSESKNSRTHSKRRSEASARLNETNQCRTDWMNYFRIRNSSQAFSKVHDYTEMKIRTLLTRRKRRRKRSVGWQRWSNEYIYGVLGLY
ncbi:MAG: group II intron maturase-specific domain-containing protein [Bacillus sp. (in: firmicutes)]|uniref:group II intron maturase-specific domain-containing protein n=1 Tax=Bacillus sp. TaxID=1409 RepID=UPI0039E2D766